jgi:hypothetical protein
LQQLDIFDFGCGALQLSDVDRAHGFDGTIVRAERGAEYACERGYVGDAL